jgi:adenylate cyclase
MPQTLQQWAGASRIIALVFTDVVDSTRIGNNLGDENWVDELRYHFMEGRVYIEQYEGYEIKIIGDSFMVAFRTAVQALDFALALHNTGDPEIKIRAGIHVGPVRIIENDIFGLMVNYTKRVESAATGAWIMLSDEAKRHIDYEKATRHSQLRFLSSNVPLKGFDEPQRIWRVRYPDDDVEGGRW